MTHAFRTHATALYSVLWAPDPQDGALWRRRGPPSEAACVLRVSLQPVQRNPEDKELEALGSGRSSLTLTPALH